MGISKIIGFAFKQVAPTQIKGANVMYVTDPLQKKVTQTIAKSVENLTHIASNIEPEEVVKIQNLSNQIKRYGLSNGDLKYYTANDPGLNLLADNKFIDAALKRKNLAQLDLLSKVTEENKKIFTKFLKDKNISDEQLESIVHLITEENAPILKQLLKDKTFNFKLLSSVPQTHFRSDNIDVLKQISKNGKVSTQEMLYIIASTNKSNSDIAIKLLEKAGDNSNGLNSILGSVYAPVKLSAEELKSFQLKKQLLSELLENPKFKLGADEKGMENYLISKVLSVVTPENSQLAKSALIERNIDLYDLSKFLKDVTGENQSVAKRILAYASKDVPLPNLNSLDLDLATKYLDEISKINNPQVQSQYVRAISDISKDNFDEVLQIIRTTSPENSKHASSLISCINRGLKKDEAELLINMIEQSGRKLSIDDVVNIAVLGSGNDVQASKFLERILNNKSISDHQLQSIMCKYYGVTNKIKDTEFQIPLDLKRQYSKGLITQAEYDKAIMDLYENNLKKQDELVKTLPDILDSLFKNKNLDSLEVENIFSQITPKNIEVVKQYAQNPKISKMSLGIISPENISEVERLADINIPNTMQGTLLQSIQQAGGNKDKFYEVLPKLLPKEIVSDGKNIKEVLSKIDDKTIKYIDEILQREDLTLAQINSLLNGLHNSANVENIMKLVKNRSLKPEYFTQILEPQVFKLYEKNPELVGKALDLKVPLLVSNPKCKSLFGSSTVLITDVIGEKRLANILKGLEEAKVKYNAVPKDILSFNNFANANDRFITLAEYAENSSLYFKFDKKTGKLVSINQPYKSINISNKAIVEDFVSQDTKSMGNSGPYRISSSVNGKNGKYGITYTESAIKGQYDIYRTNPDGSTIRVGHALITPNGAKHVKRTLTALDGSKSTLAFREDKLGNTYLHSVITDKNGQKLSEIKRTFKVLSKNHFVSTKDGQAYDIVFTDKKVVVTKLDNAGKKTKEKVQFNIKDISLDDANLIMNETSGMSEDEIPKIAGIFKRYGIEPMTIDKSCVEMLKRLPGDEWFVMSKHAQFIMPQNNTPGNACFCGNSIFVSKELSDNLGVFCHELGHAKFYGFDLANDKELYKIYNAEKKAYTANFPEARIKMTDYFLNDNKQTAKKGLNEMVAETNMISDTIQTADFIQDRTIFMEENFPKTIAYLRQKYN